MYSQVNHFIRRLAVIFVLSVTAVWGGFFISRLHELNIQLDFWAENFRNSLYFMETNGFFNIHGDLVPRGSNGFIFDSSGNILKSNIDGLEGVNISPSAMFLAVKELENGEIYIGLHPDFFTGEQKVFVIARKGELNICLRYPLNQFFPAKAAGADAVTIIKSSRIIYSNIPEWVGASFSFKPFQIISGRAYLVGVAEISQMRHSKILFYKNITLLLILVFCLIIICAISLSGLFHVARRVLTDVQALKGEQLFIAEIAESLSRDINSVMVSTSSFDAFDEVLKKQTSVLNEINAGFVENRTVLELFSRFTDASRGLLKQLNEEAEKRVGIQNELIRSQEEALDEKDLLISEIHHRVKNNLQIVAAILSISGSGEEPRFKEFVNTAVGRIHSIAVVHEILYSYPDVSKIPAESLLHELSASINDKPGLSHISLDCTIDDISFGLNELIPLGLIFNEFISNSIKHAFGKDETGIITVSIRSLDDNIVSVSYSDSGSGIPEEYSLEASGGVGLMLVKDLVVQLGGQLKIEKNTGKTIFSFNFPLLFDKSPEF